MTTNVIVTDDTLAECIDELNAEEIIALDTETNITETMHTRYFLGFSAYAPTVDKAYYFPIRHTEFMRITSNITKWTALPRPQHVVYHNGKFDRQVFKTLEFNFDRVPFDDTMLMSYVLNENPPHGLKDLADKYIGKNSSKDAFIIAGLVKGFTWEKIPMEVMAEYAMTDTILTWSLYKALASKLGALDAKQTQIYTDDLAFNLILQGVEERGIKVDPVEARIKSAQCSEVLEQIKKELGYDPAKPTQLGLRLYSMPPDGLGLKPISRGAATKSFPDGRPSMGVAELEEHHHPEVGRVLEFRRTVKAKTSYYDAWPSLVDTNNRIHPTYNQHSTVTSRLSCSGPNMQQIPRDSDETETKARFPVKKLIRAEKGYEVWELDYSQQELRLASIYAQEEAMLQVFRGGDDPHQLLADTLHVTRFIGKTVNFLLPYGGGADRLFGTVKKLAPNLSFTFQEAYNVHAAYHVKYPGYRRIAYECANTMEARKYIQYWSGRRRHMYNDYHKAFNSLIQGGCGEIMRRSMRMINNLGLDNTQIISQVHDSLWVETRDVSELQLIKREMEWPSDQFGLPFPVDMKRIA